jgi:hypothetical protein
MDCKVWRKLFDFKVFEGDHENGENDEVVWSENMFCWRRCIVHGGYKEQANQTRFSERRVRDILTAPIFD